MLDKSLHQLLLRLADGEYHSGDSLGKILGVSRAAVWKKLQQLLLAGIEVQSVKGRGYRIDGGLDLLDCTYIDKRLGADVQLICNNIVDSTNAMLMRRASTGEDIHRFLCVAESQTQGKGRRGRDWYSPFGKNLYFSLGWQVSEGVKFLEGISLAVGVEVCEALQEVSNSGFSLKWPNDILIEQKKLGGILVEVSGDASGDCQIILGVGLNIYMQEANIDQPWVALKNSKQDGLRNQILISVVSRLVNMLSVYHERRFLNYVSRWQSLCADIGKTVELASGKNRIAGEMLGVSANGELRLRIDNTEQTFSGGELSLRRFD